jgi:phage terminase large subunit GpA-like protein
MELLEDYTDENLPAGIICITCGSDVQGGTNPRIEMEILGHGFEGETWSIDYVVLPGDIRDKKVLEDHDAQLNRKFIREDGLEMMITGGLMDSGFQTSEVYNYTSVRNRRGIFACKGVNTGELCKASTSAFKKFTKKVALMTVNVDDAKDTVFTRLKKEKGQPGYCHFPAHYTQQYFDSLTNEEKKEKKHAGRIIGYTWSKKKEHMPNEALDVRVYNLAALQRYIDKNKTFLQQLKFQQDKQVERMRAGVQDVKPTGRRVRSSGLPRA